MPSLYETTANTGEVSSSNFTTLYNASGLAVPNAGAGSITGNLNVGGNLTVQGTSLLIGAVTLQSTLSLPNYTFPTPDGSTDQVLVTDGSGNLYWTDVSAIPGAAYSISATTATGGANLTLTDSAGGTDSVKFAGGTNITVSRTDANTITIDGSDLNTTYTMNASATTGGANLNLVGSDSSVDSVKFAGGTNITVSRTDADTITISTVADNIPDGTAKGQVLYWDGSAWTANSTITSSAAVNRLAVEYANSTAGSNAAIFLRKNYGATNYTTNDGVGIAFQLDSDAQVTNQIATINAQWNASAPYISLNTNVNNNTTGPFVSAATFSTAQATLPGDLAVNGGDITTTSVTGNLFNTNATVVNIGDAATTEVNLGSALSGRVQIKSPTIVGANTTQAVFNTVATTVNAFGAATALTMGASTGQTKINNQLYITQTDPPAIFERKVLAADVSPSEAKGAVRLFERVTDAVNNNTDDAGPSVVFGRTYGASGGTEKLFGSMGSVWYGTTNKAKLQFNWSTDDYTEPTPGTFPQTYTLLSLASDDATFFNNSLYVDYAHVDSTKTATSITGGNTLVFGSAHGYSIGDRILFQSATQNGLTQSTYYYVLSAGFTTTQIRVSNQAGGTALTLTNGTGLTLTFATVSNRVGVNTTTPAYTLDVDGDVGVSGDIYLSGYQIDINSPQAGQAILFDGTKFLNSNQYEFTNAAYRSQFINNSSTAGSIASAEFLKSRASLVDGYASGILMGQVVSGTETYTHRALSQYGSTGNNQYLIQTDPIGNFNPASTTIVTQLAVSDDDLFLNGTNLTFNANSSGPFTGLEAGLTVNRSTTPGSDATFQWIEDDLRWAANGTIYTAGNFVADGPSVSIDADASAANSYLYMHGTDGTMTFNNTDTQFEFNNDVVVSGNVDGTSITIDDTRAKFDTGNVTTWASGSTITLSITSKNVSKCIFYIEDNTTGYTHTVEALALRTPTGSMLTTYGELYSNSALATFTTDISGTDMRIRGTNSSANTLTVSIMANTLL